MAANSGKRWVEILRIVRDDLPGTWTLRGRGLKTTLFREPIGWELPWIGGSKVSSMRMHAGVMPAVDEKLTLAMGSFGLDMADIRRGPRSIELGAEDDLDVARTFVHHSLARIDELIPLAARAERGLQVMLALTAEPRSEMDLPSPHVRGAPGWRIVNDSGDPVEAAEQCIRFAEVRYRDAEYKGRLIAFYGQLIDLWRNGGRTAAVEFLAERRDRQLAELGYGDDAIVE